MLIGNTCAWGCDERKETMHRPRGCGLREGDVLSQPPGAWPPCVWLPAFLHQHGLDRPSLLTGLVFTFLHQQVAFKALRCQSGNQ